MIPTPDYVHFLGTEYLDGYVEQGGAAVKFLVVEDDLTAAQAQARLLELARTRGYLAVGVDAAVTRVHLLEELFFEVARQVDWDALALATARRAATAAGYPPPAGVIDLSSLATHHGVEARELKRDLDRALQHAVYRDYGMVQEFRIAMLRLCQAGLQTGQVTEAEHGAVLEWLRGELRQISALRSALIFRKIARHNARQMLFSLAHWLSLNGRSGLVLVLDVRRLTVARRPILEERSGRYYTRASLLDAYELLRQLIDNTDELANCAVFAIASPELLTDPARGIDAYQALKLRIFDEVRDRNRDNPFSSLVRLGAA